MFSLESLEQRMLLTATIVTDQTDYAFGTTALISGSGFAAEEEVQLQVTHADGTAGSNADPQNQPWQVQADAEGSLNTSWFVNDPDAVGATYILTATGLASGLIAATQFTDAATATSTISIPASGTTYGPATWTGTISGTASPKNNTSHASAVGVSIKNNSTNQYWNGTSFSSATEQFLSATLNPLSPANGATAAWSLPFASTNLANATSYTVRSQANDSGNNLEPTPQSSTFTFDSGAPTVSNVSSTTANASYKAGNGIAITVAFSEVVNVTGTPQLTLNSGGTASYASGTNSNLLTFNYTVLAGQNSTDLDYSSTSALTLNGGAIKDSAGNDANLTLAAPGGPASLGNNKSIVIDTAAPTAPSAPVLAANSDSGVAGDNRTNNTTPTFTGTAELGSTVTIFDGSTQVGTGATTPAGNYSIAVSALTTGSHTITAKATDVAGNVSTASDSLAIIIDNVVPAAPTLTSPTLAVSTNAATYTLTGTAEANALLQAWVDANNNNVKDANENTVAGFQQLTGGTTAFSFSASLTANAANNFVLMATDAAANQSPARDVPTITQDSIAPAVSTVTSAAANTVYKAGAIITITVAFSESVNVTGTPQLALNSGGTANYASGGGGTTLSFTYTVGAGDSSTDLDYSATTSLTLNGGTIRDPAGNDASLTLATPGTAGSLGFSKSIVIDTTVPAGPVLNGPAGPISTNTATITLAGTAEANTLVEAWVDANNSGVKDPTETTRAGFQQLTAGGTAFSFSAALSSNTANHFVLTASDAAGNLSAATVVPTITQDNVAPAVTLGAITTPTNNASPALGGVGGLAAGDASTVTVKLYSGSTATGSPIQTLPATRDGTTGAYTIQPSPALADGTYTAQASQLDAAGNTGTSPARTFTIDTVAPVVSSINRLSTNPSNATSVQFRALFGESVSGVDGADFSLAGTGISGASISAVTGSGTTYTITVSTGTGDGTLGLNIAASPTITDSAGNALPGSFVGQIYTIDKTNPSSLITFPAAAPYNSTSWTGTITGTAADTGGSGLSAVQVSILGSVNGKYWNGTAFNSATEVFTTATGTSGWSMALAASKLTNGASYTVHVQAIDAAGNTESPGSTDTFTYDTTAPTAAISPVTTAVYAAQVSITGTASDATAGLSGIAVTIMRDNVTQDVLYTGNATINSGTWSFSYTPGEAGAQVVAIIATDNAGNATPVSRQFSVAKATLNVQADNKAKAQGSANPGLTYSLNGFVNGDGAGVVTGTPSLATVATASSRIGLYSITPTIGTLAASNYDFAFVNGVLSVTGIEINGGAAQRSMITQIKAVFAQPLAGTPTLSYAAGSTNTLPSVTPTISDNGQTFTYSFGANRTLADAVQDGIYKLTLADAGTGQSLYKAFHSLFGDSSGDGTVSNLEILSIRSATYVSFMDYNGDGVFTAVDYNQALARRAVRYSYSQ